MCLRRTRWRRAAAQARQQHDGWAGAPCPPQVHLVKQTPRGGCARLRLVNSSWPDGPLLPVPREPWSQSSQFLQAAGHGGRQDARRQKRAWQACVPRKDGLHCPPQQGSWLARGASLESPTDVYLEVNKGRHTRQEKGLSSQMFGFLKCVKY